MLRVTHSKRTAVRWLAAFGVVAFVTTVVLISGRFGEGSVKEKVLAQAYTLENCAATTIAAHNEYCVEKGAVAAEICEHRDANGMAQALTCCNGVRADEMLEDVAAEHCDEECVARFYEAWHNSQSLPLELTVDGRMGADGKCHCVDTLCIVDADLDPVLEATADARLHLDRVVAHTLLHADGQHSDGEPHICGTEKAFAEKVSEDADAYAHALGQLAHLKKDETYGDLPQGFGCKYQIKVRFVSDGRFSDAEAAAEIANANQMMRGKQSLSATFADDWSVDNQIKFILADNAVDSNVPATCNYHNRGSASFPAAVNPHKQLNVMVCGALSDNLVGIAVFPWDPEANTDADVILMSYTYMPNYPFVLAHEMGHSIGLWHTFQGYCDDGDQVEDTPAVTEVDRTCNEDATGCGGQKRMAENVMSYTDCENRGISKGQYNRILEYGEENQVRHDLYSAKCGGPKWFWKALLKQLKDAY